MERLTAGDGGNHTAKVHNDARRVKGESRTLIIAGSARKNASKMKNITIVESGGKHTTKVHNDPDSETTEKKINDRHSMPGGMDGERLRAVTRSRKRTNTQIPFGNNGRRGGEIDKEKETA